MKLSQVTHLVIHCSDSPNGASHDISDIDLWHKERGFRRCDLRYPDGWRHVGYHYVIPCGGGIQLGRHSDEVGAHCYGINSQAWGVCLIGRDQFALAQWETLRHVAETARRLAPLIKIVGHREFNKDKTCPGFDVQAWLAGGMQPLAGHVLRPPGT